MMSPNSRKLVEAATSITEKGPHFALMGKPRGLDSMKSLHIRMPPYSTTLATLLRSITFAGQLV